MMGADGGGGGEEWSELEDGRLGRPAKMQKDEKLRPNRGLGQRKRCQFYSQRLPEVRQRSSGNVKRAGRVNKELRDRGRWAGDIICGGGLCITLFIYVIW